MKLAGWRQKRWPCTSQGLSRPEMRFRNPRSRSAHKVRAARADRDNRGPSRRPMNKQIPFGKLRAGSHRAFSPIRNDKGKMNGFRRIPVIARILALVLLAGSTLAQNTVHYTA